MGLIDRLVQEHLVILDFLKYFKKMIYSELSENKPTAEDYQNALTFISSYVDSVHHGKEELGLFPDVYELGLMMDGGPKCSLFFDVFLDYRFSDKLEKEAKEIGGIAPYVVKNELKGIVEDRHPLAIPLKDHEASYYAISILKVEIEKRKNNKEYNSMRIFRTGNMYTEMLHYHIRKEDECLFVRLQQVLPQEVKDKINLWGEKFDSDAAETISSSLAALDKLKSKYS